LKEAKVKIQVYSKKRNNSVKKGGRRK